MTWYSRLANLRAAGYHLEASSTAGRPDGDTFFLRPVKPTTHPECGAHLTLEDVDRFLALRERAAAVGKCLITGCVGNAFRFADEPGVDTLDAMARRIAALEGRETLVPGLRIRGGVLVSEFCEVPLSRCSAWVRISEQPRPLKIGETSSPLVLEASFETHDPALIKRMIGATPDDDRLRRVREELVRLRDQLHGFHRAPYAAVLRVLSILDGGA